jgi:hypothetical protein
LGSVQENVCSIVDFAPFGFTNTIHLLNFWVIPRFFSCCGEFCWCKGRSGIGADEAWHLLEQQQHQQLKLL